MAGHVSRQNGRKGGRPTGAKSPHTLDKLAAREFVRQRVTATLGPLIQAQIANACGIGHLYTRRKDGKYSRVEDQAHIERLLTEGEERKDYWIVAKDPSVQAFNRSSRECNRRIRSDSRACPAHARNL